MQNAHLPIREFSRLTGINRDNLRFYDRIGLLSPEVRGENRYRYYSRRQLGSAYLIASLRELEIGLEEIKHYSQGRTPARMLALFAQQAKRISAEIERLQEMHEMMAIYSERANEALSHEENAVLLEQRAADPLFFCPPLAAGRDIQEEMVASYDFAASKGVNLSYPLGAVVRYGGDVERGATPIVSRYYFRVLHGHNAQKPAGLYAVAYGRCDPWKPEAIYQRLWDFLRQQELTPISDAYEEALLDDMAVEGAGQHCVRVEVEVARKSGA